VGGTLDVKLRAYSEVIRMRSKDAISERKRVRKWQQVWWGDYHQARTLGGRSKRRSSRYESSRIRFGCNMFIRAHA
jgi:hypothetical protein